VKMGKFWTALMVPLLWRYLDFLCFYFLIKLDGAFCFFFFFWIYYFFVVSQPDDLLSQKIQSLCPTITGNVCCSEAQFDTLRSQVQQV
jgi:hypothetical protein